MRDNVLDLSQYDLPTFDAACLKAQGAQGAILGVFSRGNPPEDMAEAGRQLKRAGVPILGFYGLIYFGDTYGQMRDVSWAIELAKRFGAKRVWLDCEIDANQAGWTAAPTPTPAQRVQAIRHAVETVQHSGLIPGIYTAAWWWNPNTAASRAFAHLPLWHAQYGVGGAPRPPVTNVAYGGWTNVAIHQYTSIKVICNRGRDHNYYFLEEDFAEDMDEATVRAIARQEIENAQTAYLVRSLANLAINGGDGAYTDAAGDPLPLVRDQALIERVDNIEQSGGGSGLQPGQTGAFEYKGVIE